MRRLFFIQFLIFHSLIAYDQIIEGTVFDKETGGKINYAAVYFERSFVGTYTDKEGNFRIDVTKNVGMPLSVSAIGYFSLSISYYSNNEPVIVHLTPKVYNLKEVIVNARSQARDRRNDLRTFRAIFLGTSSNALKCRIMNENDISFSSGTDKDTLRAYANNPLQIVNKALGYHITYFLDIFEYDNLNGTFYFKGNIIFKEDLAYRGAQKTIIENERLKVYKGSRMHFFRELWADNLNTSGFEVTNQSRQSLSYRDIVDEGNDHKKYLLYNEPLCIAYYLSDKTSRLDFLQSRVYFDSTGYHDAFSARWEGNMVDQRIGDELPYEFVVKNGKNHKP